MDRIVDVIAGITAVAMVTTLVGHKGTANVIDSAAKFYTGALAQAMGRAG